MPIEASAEPIARGVLVEVRTMGSKRRVLRAALERAFPQCDGLIAQDDIRVPGLFVSDMDSTMIGQECIDELAGFAGLRDKVAAITERAMQGELDFENALRERVSLLEGLDESAITRCLAERIRPNPGARELVETLNSIGCTTVLVTGGFHHFADPVAEQIGFARVVGNRLAVAGGKLTGGLDGPVVDSSTKKAVLDEEQGRLAAGTASAAAGDGANDIPMIEAATYGIAFRAKPKAREVADCWIDRGDLTSILTLLGIK
ncbi:MAG: phosphoserine phosphatase SerB [Erythrobacter sp.]|nr:phosphoserine phosphatase SerB [Erythrobacter sp.]